MVNVNVVDRSGTSHSVDLEGSDNLMRALRDGAGFEIAGECGGFCICGTCHVYITGSQRSALPPLSEEESELVEQLQYCNSDSRLACQIALDRLPEGLMIQIAPEE